MGCKTSKENERPPASADETQQLPLQPPANGSPTIDESQRASMADDSDCITKEPDAPRSRTPAHGHTPVPRTSHPPRSNAATNDHGPSPSSPPLMNPDAEEAGTSSANVHSPLMITDAAESFLCHHVYDGDTLTLADERRVRLLGIDAPEIKEKQPFAEESRDFLRRFCAKKQIFLEFDGEREDKYGRLLAYVFVKGYHGAVDLCVNGELLKAGLARWYHPGDAPLRHAGYFRRCMAEAMEARAGQWEHYHSRGNVFVTTNGKAYHIASCSNIPPHARLRTIDESQALAEGLNACRTCLAAA